MALTNQPAPLARRRHPLHRGPTATSRLTALAKTRLFPACFARCAACSPTLSSSTRRRTIHREAYKGLLKPDPPTVPARASFLDGASSRKDASMVHAAYSLNFAYASCPGPLAGTRPESRSPRLSTI